MLVEKTVSLVIPVFNTEKSYLVPCIESALSQDYPSLEVLVVDDGSGPTTKRILDSFSGNGLTVLHKENGGPSDARNYGVVHCSGDYVFFLDSDDALLRPDAISLFVERAASSDADIVVGQFHLERRHDFDLSCASGREWLLRCVRDTEFSFTPYDQLFSKELLLGLDHLFVKGIIHEDEEFVPRALVSSKRVVGMDVRTYKRNRREGSLTTSPDISNVFERCRSKFVVAGLHLSCGLYSDDTRLRRLMDERAFSFVAMAFYSWAKSIKMNDYHESLLALANEIDYSRSHLSLRRSKAFRNWLCMQAVRVLGVERFVSLLSRI